MGDVQKIVSTRTFWSLGSELHQIEYGDGFIRFHEVDYVGKEKIVTFPADLLDDVISALQEARDA